MPGDDIIRGSAGADELWGGNGDDVIDPGDNGADSDELDIVHGSAGDDRIVYTGSGANGYQQLEYSDLIAGIMATIDGVANGATIDKGSAGTETAFRRHAGGAGPPIGRHPEARAAGCGTCGGNDEHDGRCTIRRGELACVRRGLRALSPHRQRKDAENGA